MQSKNIKYDVEASHHKPGILHCAFCVFVTRFQGTFSQIVLQLLILLLL